MMDLSKLPSGTPPEGPTGEKEEPSGEGTEPSGSFEALLQKTTLLKDFAIKNNYDIDPKTLKELNDLASKRTGKHDGSADERTKLDYILADLTAVTFPTTIDSLSEEAESHAYKQFKRLLFCISAFALLGAIVGFTLSVKPLVMQQLANSVLALSLGLLGAAVYSFFAVLRVIPAQAFNPQDAYANYARLFLGLLLGWVFYFTFAREAFEHLASYAAGPAKVSRADVLLLVVSKNTI